MIKKDNRLIKKYTLSCTGRQLCLTSEICMVTCACHISYACFPWNARDTVPCNNKTKATLSGRIIGKNKCFISNADLCELPDSDGKVF